MQRLSLLRVGLSAGGCILNKLAMGLHSGIAK